MPENAPQYTPAEINNGKFLASIAYLGLLVVIPLLISRDNKYVMFHTGQGLALLGLSVIAFVIFEFFDKLFLNIIEVNFCGGSLLYFLTRAFIIVLIIIGIINAATGKAAKLPLIGELGEKFNLVKQ